MTTELSKSEYQSTMRGGMQDVTETAEPVVDIWPFVEQLVQSGIVLPYVLAKFLVEKVYRNSEGSFDHVLLPTDKSNFFVAVIVDLHNKEVKGYYRLNFNKEYGN
jgi:hypothetical protein